MKDVLYSLVVPEVVLAPEGLVAHVARVRALVRVRPLVDEQVVALGEVALAELADELLPRPRRAARRPGSDFLVARRQHPAGLNVHRLEFDVVVVGVVGEEELLVLVVVVVVVAGREGGDERRDEPERGRGRRERERGSERGVDEVRRGWRRPDAALVAQDDRVESGTRGPRRRQELVLVLGVQRSNLSFDGRDRHVERLGLVLLVLSVLVTSGHGGEERRCR